MDLKGYVLTLAGICVGIIIVKAIGSKVGGGLGTLTSKI